MKPIYLQPMELIQRTIHHIKDIFEAQEKESQIKTLTKRWKEFGGPSGLDVDMTQIAKLAKRAKLSVAYLKRATSFEDIHTFQLLCEEQYFLHGIKNTFDINSIAYLSGWLRLHWQISDELVKEEGFFTVHTPKEICLPNEKIPSHYCQFTDLNPFEALRRRRAIKKALSGLELLAINPNILNNPELHRNTTYDRKPSTPDQNL